MGWANTIWRSTLHIGNGAGIRCNMDEMKHQLNVIWLDPTVGCLGDVAIYYECKKCKEVFVRIVKPIRLPSERKH